MHLLLHPLTRGRKKKNENAKERKKKNENAFFSRTKTHIFKNEDAKETKTKTQILGERCQLSSGEYCISNRF